MTTPAVTESAPSTPAPSAPESQTPATAAPAAAATTSEPEIGWTQSERSNSIDRLAREGYENMHTDGLLQQLAAKGEVTVADLRQLPGTQGMSDEQLQAMWNEAQAPKGQPRDQQGRFTKAEQEAQAAAAGATAADVKRAWKALTAEGVEVADLSKMTASELLALQFEYQANGKPQRKSFDEVVRNAQLGHYNAERYEQVTRERNISLERAREFEQKYSAAAADKQTWVNALAAAAQGKYEPMQALLDAYIEAIGKPADARPSEEMVPRSQIEAQAAADRVWTQQIVPRATQIAEQYSIPQADVEQGIEILLAHEPQEFLTAQRLEQILTHELPMHIERARAEGAIAAPAAPVADPRDTEIAELKRQLAATQAGQHNKAIEHVHKRRAAAPPAATPVSGQGKDMPQFDGAAGAREWLNNYKG